MFQYDIIAKMMTDFQWEIILFKRLAFGVITLRCYANRTQENEGLTVCFSTNSNACSTRESTSSTLSAA